MTRHHVFGAIIAALLAVLLAVSVLHYRAAPIAVVVALGYVMLRELRKAR